MATASVLRPIALNRPLPADHPPIAPSSTSSLSCPFASPSPFAHKLITSTTPSDFSPLGHNLPDVSLYMTPISSVSPLQPDSTTLSLLATIQTTFLPTSTLYASLPIAKAFNWSALILDPSEVERTWYGVAFRSRRKHRPSTPLSSYYSHHLYLADSFAHSEAQRTGSLLCYWYGSPHPTSGDNLATCLWTSRDEAVRATKGEKHKEAVRWVGEAYEVYKLERYVVRKRRGEGGVVVEDWHGQEIGEIA